MASPAFTAPVSVSANACSLRGASLCSFRTPVFTQVSAPSRRSRVVMAAPDVLEKKVVIVDRVKERLETAQMIFQVPLPGLTVANVYDFKQSLPEGSTAMTVKNKLMVRAVADSDWEIVGPILKNSNIWIFVDDDIKGSVEAYKKFEKDNGRDPIIGGALEATLYDSAGIETVASLPSKLELITQVAILVKKVPTKVATSIKQVPTKVARAIKLAVADEGSDETPAAEAA